MKIQVTFDRTTKKEFREICVQRLKNFVSQIKHNEYIKSKENYCTQLRQLQHKKTQWQRQTLQEKNVQVSKDLQVLLQIPRDCKKSRKENKTHQKIRNTEATKLMQNQKQQPQNRKKNPININMSQIKDNLSKIMQKFEKQQQENSMKNKELEQKVQTTNSKLDMLIDELTQKKLLGEDKNMIISVQSEVGSKQFLQKFSQLEAKYNAIKHNSLNNSASRQSFNKSLESTQQTSDSLTFRQNYCS